MEAQEKIVSNTREGFTRQYLRRGETGKNKFDCSAAQFA